MKNNFKEYKSINIPTWTNKVILFWKKNKIFKKSILKNNNTYVLYEGPPSANGKPGIHHILARTIKDIFCRYHTLKGKKVYRKAGWDTHGLPIELEVEKKLNISKVDIGNKISIKRFNNLCKKYVMRYIKLWSNITDKIGYWVDQVNPYITYNSKYIESVWWCLKQFYNKGILYKGYIVQPYSPPAGTGLSNHEINIPGSYKNITDTAITIPFKSKKGSLPYFLYYLKGNIYLLSWTTTPWTIPSNTAITIDNICYILVETYNPYTLKRIKIILSQYSKTKLLKKNFVKVKKISKLDFYKKSKEIPYFIKKVFFGKKIIGVSYYPIINWVKPYYNYDNAFKIINGNFINQEEGTGIVHTSPTFGVEDYKLCKSKNIALMLIKNNENQITPIVDTNGRYVKIIPYPFYFKYIKNDYYKNKIYLSIDQYIALLLKNNKKLFKLEKYTHPYPHCWRTDKPIIYYPLNSWLLKTTYYKNNIIYLNKKINWIPKSTGKNRFENWLNNMNDWNLSRSRYWGIPLPIWKTEDYKEEKIIGSIKELINEINKSCNKGFMKKNPFTDFIIDDMTNVNYNKIDLHKHIVDSIILVSSMGKHMIRESDLIDVWFDSGTMPFAQWHYPFENKDKIDKFYPADCIAEGIDQTRGWFYTLHVISSILFNKIAYKNVIANGLILDKEGKKMSKSKGNTIYSLQIITNYSPDVVRWYMVSTSHPWETIKFNANCIENTKKRFFGTFYNIYYFFTLYANIDYFFYKESIINFEVRPSIDRWILSSLNKVIKSVDKYYNSYDPTCVTKTIENFVINKLSNWYIRLCRNRFWKGKYNKDKISAYQTLHDCLLIISKLIAPIAPFISDFFYKNLIKVSKTESFESIHLSMFPKYDMNIIDEYIDKCMHLAQQITSLALSIRKQIRIKVRQPLNKLVILNASHEKYSIIQYIKDIVKNEINVKEILYVTQTNKKYLLIKNIKPNYKIMGPRLGKNINEIYNQLNRFSQIQINEFEINKNYSINNITIYLNEVEIYTKDIKEMSINYKNGITIALDNKIDKKLKYEGIAREIIHNIQYIRKKHKLLVYDRINLIIKSKNNIINNAVYQHRKYICDHTLTTYLDQKIKVNDYEKIIYDGNTIKIYIKKNKQ
jgi:isoleucyl-tRNA synthetase